MSTSRRGPRRSTSAPTRGELAPGHELGGGIGQRGLGAAPAKVLEEGHEEYGIRVHEAGADGEGREGAAEEVRAAAVGRGRRRGAHDLVARPVAMQAG